VIVIVVAAPIAGFGWWLLSPLLLDKTVEEEFPFAHSATVPDGMSRGEIEDTMATMAKMDSPMEDAMPHRMAEAVALKTGQFKDADRAHRGSGTATIYRLPDGSHMLRLEILKVTNGPALVIILSPHPNPDNSGQVRQEGHVELAKLKGNIGNQNYPLPDGVDPCSFNSVIIYCKPFKVIFSIAPLS
jgi:hypothetical protein